MIVTASLIVGKSPERAGDDETEPRKDGIRRQNFHEPHRSALVDYNIGMGYIVAFTRTELEHAVSDRKKHLRGGISL